MPTQFGTTEFNTFMFYKMKVIKDSLINNDLVLYTDGDVVFKKDFIDSLSKFQNLDLKAIKDFDIRNPNKVSICAGFMILKSNFKNKATYKSKYYFKKEFSDSRPGIN